MAVPVRVSLFRGITRNVVLRVLLAFVRPARMKGTGGTGGDGEPAPTLLA